jgi:hypothetical protein
LDCIITLRTIVLFTLTASLLSCGGNPPKRETPVQPQPDAVRLELIDRCQQMGDRIVKDMHEGDASLDIPEANRHYTHRSHYNFEERKCFVQTERPMTAPFVGTVMMTQIIDVNNGAGGLAVAERDIPMSGKEPMALFRGKQELPTTPENLAWFDGLMTK